MEICEEIDFSFYRFRKALGEKELETFLKAKFKKLGKYDLVWGKWIEKEFLDEDSGLYLFFYRSGLRDKSLMSAMFLRMFYTNARQNKFDKPTAIG